MSVVRAGAEFQMKGDGDESEDNALVFELKAACTVWRLTHSHG